MVSLYHSKMQANKNVRMHLLFVRVYLSVCIYLCVCVFVCPCVCVWNTNDYTRLHVVMVWPSDFQLNNDSEMIDIP